MKLSQIMSQNEWAWLHSYANSNQVNPVLIAAIGWHETHWGRLGMGRYGYHLGVSCWGRDDKDFEADKRKGIVDWESYSIYKGKHNYGWTTFKGLHKQVKWAVNTIRNTMGYNFGYPDVENLNKKWVPTDKEFKWAKSVWSIYKSIEVDMPAEYVPSEPEKIPTDDNKLPSVSGLVLSIASHLEEIVKLLRNWRL